MACTLILQNLSNVTQPNITYPIDLLKDPDSKKSMNAMPRLFESTTEKLKQCK
jgi:hypothetical protein